MNVMDKNPNENTNNSATNTNVQTSSKKLSEEAKRKLLELNAELQEQRNSADPNFIKFKKGGETKVLRFEPELTRKENVKYPDNPKPILQCKFYASERIDGNKWTRVREWTVAPTWSKLIIPLLVKGFVTLEVTRTGSGINDTSYGVTPFIE